MKVILTTKTDSDYNTKHKLKVEDGRDWNIYPLSECPEDAIIGRSLIDGHDLIAAMKLGYDAAKRGESLDIEEIEQTEEN